MAGKKLEGKYVVRVDLALLSGTELEWLISGAHSALESLNRKDDSGRCWTVPEGAVEVTLVDG